MIVVSKVSIFLVKIVKDRLAGTVHGPRLTVAFLVRYIHLGAKISSELALVLHARAVAALVSLLISKHHFRTSSEFPEFPQQFVFQMYEMTDMQLIKKTPRDGNEIDVVMKTKI